MIHLFFEQSGTFKKAFAKFQVDAIDYDWKNDYKQTDIICNLFTEIQNAYYFEKSIFDNIKPGEMIIAFFPCIRFTFRMQCNYKMLKYDTIEQQLEKNIEWFSETANYYKIINLLIIVCLHKNIKLIIENPYHEYSILKQFLFYKPKIIDKCRYMSGDNFKKPTMYYFINCEPKNNFTYEQITINDYKIINNCIKKQRSEINMDYVERFIKEQIL